MGKNETDLTLVYTFHFSRLFKLQERKSAAEEHNNGLLFCELTSTMKLVLILCLTMLGLVSARGYQNWMPWTDWQWREWNRETANVVKKSIRTRALKPHLAAAGGSALEPHRAEDDPYANLENLSALSGLVSRETRNIVTQHCKECKHCHFCDKGAECETTCKKAKHPKQCENCKYCSYCKMCWLCKLTG